MKGWIYIITNKAMPDLLKVGFSTKDPESRANELHTTGVPHRYVVEYDVLVDEPRIIEQKAHKLLKAHHENKEWFRCDISTAIIAIRQAAINSIILESNKYNLISENKNKIESENEIEQYNLGILHSKGDGITRDYSKAFEWYLKAAERGLAEAQHDVGVYYRDGIGVTQNSVKAFEWLLKAAEQGLSNAQNNLGWLYQNGNGVTRDYSKAFEWYLKAAEQGLSTAQNNLGVLYQYGNGGVTRDYLKAFEWNLKAAEQGLARAQTNLGVLYKDGNGVTKDKQKAEEWIRKAAEQGNDSAIKALKNMEKGMLHKLFFGT